MSNEKRIDTPSPDRTMVEVGFVGINNAREFERALSETVMFAAGAVAASGLSTHLHPNIDDARYVLNSLREAINKAPERARQRIAHEREREALLDTVQGRLVEAVQAIKKIKVHVASVMAGTSSPDIALVNIQAIAEDVRLETDAPF